MAKVVQIAKNLSIPHIVSLLKSPPSDNLSTLPPVKPRGGEVYLYQAQEDPDIKKDDWRCDQYRWINQGVHSLPKKSPVLTKSYFQLSTPEGPSKEFTRHSYQLISGNTNITLIHYVGNEKVATDHSHGNRKHHQERHFIRTCPSVLQNLRQACAVSTASKVYKSSVTKASNETDDYLPVLQPRDQKQVLNVRMSALKSQRISHDALYNLHELAVDMPDFIHTIRTHPDLVCVCGHRAILEELDRVLLLESPSPQLLSYDTTFQLGDFYVSILCFRHTLFKEAPVVPAAFLIHERKFEAHHAELFEVCNNLVKSLKSTKHPIVTDEERGIVNAIAKALPNLPQLRCWNHTFRSIKSWLRAHGAPSADVGVYLSDVRTLFHLSTENEYRKTLNEMKSKWSCPFFDYYQKNVEPDIKSIARWSIEPLKVYNPFSGVTNNQSESMNYVIKQLQEWKESPIDCAVLAFHYLQSYYIMEIVRGQRGLGKYHLCSGHNCIESSQPISNDTIISPEDIVNHIRNRTVMKEAPVVSGGETQSTTQSNNLTQLERAKRIIEEKNISFDPNLHTFTIIGSQGRPQAVKIFPKESCTCPSTSTCYHILAARLSIGLETDNSTSTKQKLNLTQLRRNARKCKGKRSGRKRPRPGDYSVEPAPDAMSKIGDQEVLSQIQNQSTQLAAAEPPNFPSKSNRSQSKKRLSSGISDAQPSSKRVCLQESNNVVNSDHTDSKNHTYNRTLVGVSEGQTVSEGPKSKMGLTELDVSCVPKSNKSANYEASVPPDKGLLEEQLFSSNLLRLLRTGALAEAFSSKEDGDFDATPYLNGPDEYLLSKDLDVSLWNDFRIYHGESPLREVCGGDFVVVTNVLHNQFDHFKKEQSLYLECGSLVALNELVDMYRNSCCASNNEVIEMNGKAYAPMYDLEIDDLCEWIQEKRDEVGKKGRSNILAILSENKEFCDLHGINYAANCRSSQELSESNGSDTKNDSTSENRKTNDGSSSKAESFPNSTTSGSSTQKLPVVYSVTGSTSTTKGSLNPSCFSSSKKGSGNSGNGSNALTVQSPAPGNSHSTTKKSTGGTTKGASHQTSMTKGGNRSTTKSIINDLIPTTSDSSSNVTVLALEPQNSCTTTTSVSTCVNSSKKIESDVECVSKASLQKSSVASGSISTIKDGSVTPADLYRRCGSNVPATCPISPTIHDQKSLLTPNQELALLQGKPLDGDVIDAAQKLLLKQFPKVGGLQPTYLSQVNRFSKTNGIQIHHTGMYHWVTTTTLKCAKPCSVRVMDSRWCGRLTRDMEIQIAQIYGDGKPTSTLIYELCPVQQQSGQKDCGLYAIAFATEVAHGGDPVVVSYQQSEMRKHLVSCFERGELQPFPRASKAASICSREVLRIKTYCCGLPESYSNMIECEACFNWYHFRCVGVKKKTDTVRWVCKACSSHKRRKLY